MKDRELTLCGAGAVRSRFASAPDSIRRLFFDRATAPQFADVCRTLAKSRRVYRCVEAEELERIAGTVHHGGVVAVVDAEILPAVKPADVVRWAQQREPLLLLDRIGNAHNLGAIVRSAAFFGVSKIILPDHPQAAMPSDATYRVAEGGMEHVALYLVPHLPRFIRELRDHYDVVGTVPVGGEPVLTNREGRPLAVVMGNEEHGLSPEVAAACNRLLTFPGTGRVESLNVSAAATLVVWELVRERVSERSLSRPAPASQRPVPPGSQRPDARSPRPEQPRRPKQPKGRGR
jgi:TrmH RNA methyltransferase